jgi:hypothetical protein
LRTGFEYRTAARTSRGAEASRDRGSRRSPRRSRRREIQFTSLAVAGTLIGFVACTRAFGLTGAAEAELDEMAVAASS